MRCDHSHFVCIVFFVCLFLVKASTYSKETILQLLGIGTSSTKIRGGKGKKKIKDGAVLLHIGKAGGGTALARIRSTWKLPLGQCHRGGPCPEMMKEIQPRSIITIRDPVDRFVSAFYWRITLYCDPDGGDDRTTFEHAAQHPDKYCRSPWDSKGRMIFEVVQLFDEYERDANNLAEALYDNNVQRAAPLFFMGQLTHAKYGIAQWLGEGTDFDWREQAPLIYPIVTEKPLDLEAQVDAAVHWLQKELHFSSDKNFDKRVKRVKSHNDTFDKSAASHSSETKKKPLTPKAIDNIVRYYQEDYELLRELDQLACKSEDCHQGIKSILSRRQDSLEKLPTGN